jgi:hypothetical protein
VKNESPQVREFVAAIVWRHSKLSVESQYHLPPLTQTVLEVVLNKEERMLYNRTLETVPMAPSCSVISNALINITLQAQALVHTRFKAIAHKVRCNMAFVMFDFGHSMCGRGW